MTAVFIVTSCQQALADLRPDHLINLTAIGSSIAANGPSGTDLRIHIVGAGRPRNGQLLVRVHRVLRPRDSTPTAGDGGQACLSATWRLADGTQARGVFATATYSQETAAPA